MIKCLTRSDEYVDFSHYVEKIINPLCRKSIFKKRISKLTECALSVTGRLTKQLNTYHENIKLKLEINWLKFSDTELIRENGNTTTQMFTKSNRFPVYWTSKVPVRCKQLLLNFLG